ncbi:PP2C family protein-serine/threonine phosphatase [Salinibius halmophilus]|uniref:PP2C family protein-serine/threonine phosphatase n=1 Tax=Salinibius halmophilus TaxID=1853216 RepID=UPI000E667146|nr:PP2C family protein-serine/threonine phosphatase [Salinibius halmophilus]
MGSTLFKEWSKHRSIHVWIVDDDPTIQLIIQQALTVRLSSLLETRAMASFNEAKRAIDEQKPVDLVLLDNHLGDGQGINLLPQLLSGNRASSLPVLMVSGDDDQDFLAECFNAGASDYIIKPFNVDLLIHKVKAMLGWKAAQDQIQANKATLEQLLLEREREEQMALTIYNHFVRKNQLVASGVYSFHLSASAFSGDLLLSRQSPDGRYFILLADATGHALAAAITLFPAAAMFQDLVHNNANAHDIIIAINDRLTRETPADRFIAAILLEIDPDEKMVSIWNGGLPDALVVTHDENIEQVESSDMALGILPSKVMQAKLTKYPLAKVDHIVVYSDGLNEQENSAGEPFGDDQILQLCTLSARVACDAIATAFNGHRKGRKNDDDASLYIIDIAEMIDSA